MNTGDKAIADILRPYGEDFSTCVWRVQGTAVIYHKALERIAAQARVTFDPPTLIRTERDEAVILVTGRMGERVEWSIGEALVNTNYKVSGKQAAHVYAMAEKRAKDRVILKLVGLHGYLYSEDEADEFREGRPAGEATPPRGGVRPGPTLVTSVGRTAAAAAARAPKVGEEIEDPGADLRARIDAAASINAVTDLMLDPATQAALADMPKSRRDEVRDYAKSRLVALGWPSNRGQAAQASERAPRDETVRETPAGKGSSGEGQGEKARNYTAQAAMLCGDEAFRAYLGAEHESRCDDATAAAEAVHALLDVASRAELNRNPEAAKRWRKLVRHFEEWRERRGARAARELELA